VEARIPDNSLLSCDCGAGKLEFQKSSEQQKSKFAIFGMAKSWKSWEFWKRRVTTENIFFVVRKIALIIW
jgi:hypothetical protein